MAMRVKEAVQKAKEYLPDVFDAAAGRELRLEGIEKTDDGRFWNVTFSYLTSTRVEGSELFRDYKTVKLRDLNGDFVGARSGMVMSDL